MNGRFARIPLAALAMLLGCGQPNSEGAEPPPAEAPKVANAPAPAVPQQAAKDAQAALLPPEVTLVAEQPGEATSISFVSAQPPAALLAWYRSSARRKSFSLSSELKEGAEHVVEGRAAGAVFQVRLAPGTGGGTLGILLVDS